MSQENTPKCGGYRSGRGLAASWRVALVGLALAATACAEDNKGIPHPIDRLHYPVAIAADPSGDYVYVVNSDFDVRYRTGSVIAIDLATNQLVPGSAIGIGKFGGEVVLYPTGDPDRRLAGYVPARSDAKLFWFYVEGGADGTPPNLVCRTSLPGEPDEIEECEASFVIDAAVRPRLPLDDEGLTDEEAAARAGEPVRMTVGRDAFGVAIYRGERGVGDYLLMTNPRSGRVGVFGIDGGIPVDRDTKFGGQPAPSSDYRDYGDGEGTRWGALSKVGEPVFLESWSLLGGSYTAAVSPVDGFAYATNKLSNVVVPFRIGEVADPDGLPRLWPEPEDLSVFTIVNSSSLGDYGRSIAFNRDGTRAYLAYRNPSSLVVIDKQQDDDGAHRDRFVSAVDLGLRPSKVLLAPSAADGGDLLYVVCYGDEQVYVVDPVALDVVDIIEVPGGPYDMAIVHAPEKDRFRAYVTVFERDAVAVIELDRASPFFHQVTAYVRGVDDEGAH